MNLLRLSGLAAGVDSDIIGLEFDERRRRAGRSWVVVQGLLLL